ncbi:MAG: hypothetical protein PVF58_16360 [Candidatus Methanofastidiosia archaeon]|jgi:hypothetical protein
MKQFISGLALGVGIGLLVCGLIAGSIIHEFEYTLTKYDRQIDDFYDFTHSYSFETIQTVIDQTTAFYKTNPLLREALKTFGMEQLGQLLQDIDENLDEVIAISEDLHMIRSSIGQVSSTVLYLKIGGGISLIAGVIASLWAFYKQ